MNSAVAAIKTILDTLKGNSINATFPPDAEGVEEEDPSLAPVRQEGSFCFGVASPTRQPLMFDAPAKPLDCVLSPPADPENVYHYDVAPKEDINQYYFGMLPPGVPIDLTSIARSSLSISTWTSSSGSTKSINDDDDDSAYHYDIAPKQDVHQYYFGLGKTKNPMRYSFPPAKRVKWVHTPSQDEENLYHYDIAPKQGADQYYFGLATKPRGLDFSGTVITTNTLSVVAPPLSLDDENVYYYDVAPKQDADQFYFGLAPGQSHSHFTFEGIVTKQAGTEDGSADATHWSQ